MKIHTGGPGGWPLPEHRCKGIGRKPVPGTITEYKYPMASFGQCPWCRSRETVRKDGTMGVHAGEGPKLTKADIVSRFVA